MKEIHDKTGPDPVKKILLKLILASERPGKTHLTIHEVTVIRYLLVTKVTVTKYVIGS